MYRADWNSFTIFCGRFSLPTTPPDPHVVGLYLTDLARRCKISTLERRLSGIRQTYADAGLHLDRRHPAIAHVLEGVRRQKKVAPSQAEPLLLDDLKAMLRVLRAEPFGPRDKALLLTGFVGAFRRSELVALTVEDLTFVPSHGFSIRLNHSKRNQTGRSEYKAIVYGSTPDTCPVEAINAWLEASDISEGPIFRGILPDYQLREGALNARAVSRIIQLYAERAGLVAGRYSGHSLRAGFVTQARLNGVPTDDVRLQTGHASLRQVDTYNRNRTIFANTPARRLGV